jgi:NIMA (never in mitosis gene a)-related kinase
VYKVKRVTDGQIYALKKCNLGALKPKEKENALNEIRILASINSPYVISYKEAFFDEDQLCLVMEYADDGDLYQKIVAQSKLGTYLNERLVWSIIYQVTQGLRALHELRIFHRDLKSANVFLYHDGSIKLGDFNVSKVAERGML